MLFKDLGLDFFFFSPAFSRNFKNKETQAIRMSRLLKYSSDFKQGSVEWLLILFNHSSKYNQNSRDGRAQKK